ncbi:ABC transporter substrate-binding protein [Neobacillus drentensis]|uniref:ABC transporter substrate-binding protein n=1 Tax=Neobacillus drentensis TaxID=220684 RepID=UPI002FFF868F
MKKLRIIRLMICLVLLIGLLTGCLGGAKQEASNSENKIEKSTINDPARVIRPIEILSRPQAAAPDEYETATIIAEGMKQLGLDAKVKVLPWEQLSNVVWFERDKWDITGWQQAARPERLDPDEFVYNLFHSSNVKEGYNFVGYVNKDLDSIVEKQRITLDKNERKDLIFKAQEIIAKDVPFFFNVHPTVNYVYNNKVFEKSSIVDMAGLGIKNFWTFVNAVPKGEQKDLILNSNDNIRAVNPLYISGSVDSWATELIWDRLMRVGEDGLPKTWAAEKVEWETDKKVKITLHDGMKWHDGKPVTPEDVKFSFEAPMSGEAPAYKPFVENIKSIDIVDNKTLVFNLNNPNAAFETASLAKINLIPKHIWEPIINDLKTKPENAESYQEKVPVGSGPFKFSNWKMSEEIVLAANKEHFSAPKVNRWITRIVPNMEAALGMIQNGEINFLAAYSGDAKLLEEKVKASKDLTMVSSVDLGFRFFAPNLRRAPFDDVAFRKGIASVIDRNVLVDAVWKGYAVPGDSVISPALKFWKNTKLDYPSGGVESGKKILQEAGYQWDKDGKLLYPKGKTETLGK